MIQLHRFSLSIKKYFFGLKINLMKSRDEKIFKERYVGYEKFSSLLYFRIFFLEFYSSLFMHKNIFHFFFLFSLIIFYQLNEKFFLQSPADSENLKRKFFFSQILFNVAAFSYVFQVPLALVSNSKLN